MGGIIFGRKRTKIDYGKHPPCLFETKGVGGIYMTELEFLFQFFVLMAVLGFVVFCLGVDRDD